MWHDISIDRGDVGIRVDRVVLRHLSAVPGISRTRIQGWIAAGDVLVNEQPADRPAWRMAAGDRLQVRLPDARPRLRPQAEEAPLDILYEDADLMAVSKPAGVVVHPTYRNTTGTLLNALLWHVRRNDTAAAAPSIVQRLDKQTSGVLLVAKHRDIHTALQHAMYHNTIEKDYLAVVMGRPSPARGTIDLALDRDPWDRRRVVVRDRGGQPSVTKYERVATAALPLAPGSATAADDALTLSLVRCRLVTGRTHQIRVHLSARGWPIIGDPTYGPASVPAVDDEQARLVIIGFARQALHAWRVAFAHPSTGTPIELTAPLPVDMARLMDVTRLERDAEDDGGPQMTQMDTDKNDGSLEELKDRKDREDREDR